MNVDDYARLDACGLAEGIRKRDFSAAEVRAAARAALEKVNPTINGVVEYFDDRFEQGDPLAVADGPLGGVPYMLKDAGAAEAGRLQEKGSRLLKGNRPTVSAYFTVQCQQAGLVNLGRTTTPEGALSGTTESIATGATRNPYNPELSTSGSSGGAAALVAAGALPIAHGNDGAGSIRMPASVCGLVGLKPSRGRVSVGPVVDEIALGAVAEFFLTRTVRDVAAGLNALTKRQPGEPFEIAGRQADWCSLLGAPVAGLRVGYTTTNWKTGEAVAAPIAAAVMRTVHALDELGCHVEAVEPEFDKALAYRVNAFCFDSLTVSYAAYARQHRRPFDGDHVEPALLNGYRRISAMTAEEVFGLIASANIVRRQIGRFFATYDLLVTPATPTTRLPLGVLSCSAFDSIESFRDANERLQFAFTCPFNITGQPAISLPLGQEEDGLPIGVQLVSRVTQEAVLLKAASALEQVLPWHDRRPAIHAASP